MGQFSPLISSKLKKSVFKTSYLTMKNMFFANKHVQNAYLLWTLIIIGRNYWWENTQQAPNRTLVILYCLRGVFWEREDASNGMSEAHGKVISLTQCYNHLLLCLIKQYIHIYLRIILSLRKTDCIIITSKLLNILLEMFYGLYFKVYSEM